MQKVIKIKWRKISKRLIRRYIHPTKILKWQKRFPWLQLLENDDLMICKIWTEFVKSEESSIVNACPPSRVETALFILICIYLAQAQYIQDYNGIPNPYQFSYASPSIGGDSSHQESGDGHGRVTGSYTVIGEDGTSRVVEYVADENGFRAVVRTNEPGTANLNPADVTIESTADDGYGGQQSFFARPEGGGK